MSHRARMTSYERQGRIAQLMKRDGGRCRYCLRRVIPALLWIELDLPVKRGGAPFAEYGGFRLATIDHVVPLSRGGDDHASNLVLACWKCNNVRDRASSRRHDFTPDIADMHRYDRDILRRLRAALAAP